MEEILRMLLNRLEAIGKDHEELFDSDVRQEMSNAIMEGFVRAMPGFVLPREFGLFTPEANAAVRTALAEYIVAADKEATMQGMTVFHDRLAAMQNADIHSEEGNDYDEFVGHSPPDVFDTAGNVIRTQ